MVATWYGGGECTPAVASGLTHPLAVCLLAVWMLFAHREAAAQEFVFRHYQEKEGIGNLSVSCLLKDREGFIWAGTENGLYRYDGVAFERVGERQGLDAGAIRSAVEDSAGRLWIGTSEDLYRSDGRIFKPVRPAGGHLKLLPGLRIASLSPDHLLAIDAD